MPATTGRLTFIGNATVLLEWGGFTLLTDPNFIHAHEELSLAPGVTATRLRDPARELTDLPPIDLVVLSHFHADHFDRVAEEGLPKDVPIVTPPSAVTDLEDRGFTAAVGLDTWGRHEAGSGLHRVSVTATPGRHGPPILDLALPDVMGSIVDLEGPDGSVRLYISGDTLVFEDLREIPRRFDRIDLGLFHLGGTKVGGIMLTMDGEQGAEAVEIIGPERAVPIHVDDYDRFTSPLSEFLDAMAERGLQDRLRLLERGETVTIEPSLTGSTTR
jgi:L-ascorbate metabolism protein UlaG (beta-lactamase superfamily)